MEKMRYVKESSGKLQYHFVFIGIFLLIVIFIRAEPVLASTNELQQLIDKTPENGLLKLEGKTYHGDVEITKSIQMKGNKKTVVAGDGKKNVILIKSDGVTLDTLKIKHGGMSRSTDEEYSAVRVIGNNAKLQNLNISDVYHGIYLNRSQGNTIKGNTIIGHGKKELGNQGYGIYVLRAGDNIIEKNHIKKTRDGIFVEYADKNTIKNNTVSETRYGLHYMYSNFNTFKKNKFIKNTGGAAIMHSDHITLKNNSFSYNQGSRSFGLIIQSSREITVKHNDFHLNQRGLYLEQSTENRIEENDFFHNQIGVELWTSSTAQVFVKNNFRKNDTEVITVGGESNNEWFKNGIGNYWNQSILDLDQDGVGDSPMESTSALSDLIEESELTYLFLHSPAIQIYEKANELLSKQKVMFVDKYPLIPKQKRTRIGWITSGVFLLVILLVMYRRRRFSWRIFGKKA